MDIAPAFGPLVGHEKTKTMLTQAVVQQKIAPAYLFAGPEGVGRSLAARCFAQLIFAGGSDDPAIHDGIAHRIAQGNHPDLLWVEPTFLHQGKTFTAQQAEEAGLKRKTAPQIRLSQVRDIARFVSRPPLEASRSLVVIEQAETMAEAAANGLLKTLEEPGQATLILLAPSFESLLSTLVSRSHGLLFAALGEAQLRQVLNQLNQNELLESTAMVTLAEGSPGRAIAQWERLQTMPAEIMTALEQIPQWLGGSGSPKAALTLAALVTKELDMPGQVWLMNYLQYQLWQGVVGSHESGWQLSPSARATVAKHLESLEESRRMLLRYVQPLLVWEVWLLGLIDSHQAGNPPLAQLRPQPF